MYSSSEIKLPSFDNKRSPFIFSGNFLLEKNSRCVVRAGGTHCIPSGKPRTNKPLGIFRHYTKKDSYRKSSGLRAHTSQKPFISLLLYTSIVTHLPHSTLATEKSPQFRTFTIYHQKNRKYSCCIYTKSPPPLQKKGSDSTILKLETLSLKTIKIYAEKYTSNPILRHFFV